MQCESCSVKEALAWCVRCQNAAYCSPACQDAAWAVHAAQCVPFAVLFQDTPNLKKGFTVFERKFHLVCYRNRKEPQRRPDDEPTARDLHENPDKMLSIIKDMIKQMDYPDAKGSVRQGSDWKAIEKGIAEETRRTLGAKDGPADVLWRAIGSRERQNWVDWALTLSTDVTVARR